MVEVRSRRAARTIAVVAALVVCQATAIACRKSEPPAREPLRWSGWIDDAATTRGYIKAGDFAQFGCPPGWRGVEDTAAALRGRQASTTYLGTDPPPHEGTITCVAQQEFTLPPPYLSADLKRDPFRRPLAPVSVSIGADRTTIVFRRELPRSAAIFIGHDTSCGPHVIGVRLADLLKWLSDPESATTRDFLGLVSAGCPDESAP